MKTVELVKSDSGFWTWRGNEDGYAMHTKCILAIYTGFSIGDPEKWLANHGLLTVARTRAIRKLDLGKGTSREIRVVRELAKRLNMTVSTEKPEAND